MDAMSIPGVGRMQPVSDPQGGMFSLFKAGMNYVLKDCDETLDCAQQNGASVLSGPIDAECVSVGRTNALSAWRPRRHNIQYRVIRTPRMGPMV